MAPLTSTLLPAITETVFGALAEAVGLSDWLRDHLQRDPAKFAFQNALTQALTDAAHSFPGRDLRYFGEVLRDVGGPLLARTLQPAASPPTAQELTQLRLNHLTIDSFIHYRQDFETFATLFLDRLTFHTDNQQPLQWIVQARQARGNEETLQRLAIAAEQNAVSLDALRSELAANFELLQNAARTSAVNISSDGSHNTFTTGHIAGRDLTIKNYFVTGLPSLKIDYSSRIQDFLLEYLGSKRKRVPFGGRQQQLNELHAWLDDPNPDAPPYYLMSAEAGRGKSALVCRWLAQVITRPNLDVIFVPISIRFETATQDVVFAALAARLANLYEREPEKLPPASLTAEQWKGVCQSYLRRSPPEGRQLVVILDGLDEATGWTPGRGLFSADPPEGLRVVVTARTRPGETGASGWASTLGWEDAQLAHTVTLVGLTWQGVEEALVSMGNPLDRLATQVDVVGELHRLSEGDPLLVRLYVDALVAQRERVATLGAEELRGIEPGLKGYFDRWWQDQREQWRVQGRNPITEQAHLRLLLNAIAASLGPLMLDDLAELHPDLSDSTLLRELLHDVNRWLVGDGKLQGYSYSHPRLGYYFWEQLRHLEQTEWDQRFCMWGAETLTLLIAGQRNPKVAPVYLLRHYANHLQRNDAPTEAFYALISNGWRLAWEWADMSYGGFLGNVDQVWKKAGDTYKSEKLGKAIALVQQIKAALCKTSVVAIGANMPPELLAQLVRVSLRTPVQALAIIKQIADEKQRSLTLSEISVFLPDNLIKEAWKTACTIEDKRQRIVALCSLVERFPEDEKVGLLPEMLIDAYAIDDEHDLAFALHELSSHLTPQLRCEALDQAHFIVNKRNRAYAFSAFARDLPEIELSQVIKILLKEGTILDELIQGEGSAISVLERFAANLPTAFLDEALESVKKIGFSPFRFRALRTFLPYVPEERRRQIVEEELSIALANKDCYSRPCSLGSLASWLTEEQRKKFLDNSLLTGIVDPGCFEGTFAIVEVAPYLSSETYKTAVELVYRTGYEEVRAVQLRALLPYLSMELVTEAFHKLKQVNDLKSLGALSPRLPKELLELTLQATSTINDLKAQQYILAELLIDLPVECHSTLVNDIVSLTAERDSSSPFSSPRLAVRLVPCLSGQELTNELNYQLGYPAQRFVELAPYLPKRELRKVLEAAKLSVTVRTHFRRQLACVAYLSPDKRKQLLKGTLRAIRKEGHLATRADELIALIPHLIDKHEQNKIIGEALTAIHNYERHGGQVSLALLSALSPYLHSNLYADALAFINDLNSKHYRLLGKTILARNLSPDKQSELFKEALHIACQDDAELDSTLKMIVPPLAAWATQQKSEGYMLFTKILLDIAAKPRNEFLWNLGDLMPFILALAGDEAPQAAAGIYHAIQEICEWWP